MPHIPFHPAIGFGDLMDGWFVVPQNPIRDGGTPLVPSLQATQPNRVMRKARLAELMPGQFTVPQNPLREALGGGGMGCGCSTGSCGGGAMANYTLNGLGQLNTSGGVGDFVSSIPTWLSEPAPLFPGVANWVFYGGLVIAADLYFSKRPSRGGSRRNPRRNPRRRRNIQQGFYNATGFHPIRRSKDYDPDRAGDGGDDY